MKKIGMLLSYSFTVMIEEDVDCWFGIRLYLTENI